MAKLILSVDGQVLKEFTLSKERTLIGRKPHNDIQIDNLAVSGEHAAIITILNDSFIEDLGSTNGTMVNGKPIKKHFLQNNDVVELGKHKLKYFNDAPTAATAADFEKTMIIRNPAKAAPPPPVNKDLSDTQTGLTPLAAGAAAARAPEAPKAPEMVPKHVAEAQKAEREPTKPAPEMAKPAPEMPKPAPEMPKPAPEMPRPPAAAPAAPAGASGPLREAAVQVLSGAAAGRTLDLTKNLTTIGKPGLQVAVITKRPNGFFITHVEGATYPTLNGASLGAQAHPLNDHDLIEIAGVKMEFFYKP
jgi:pSer/pThr/pTyr-binding forkhead associated (FHA) protein